MDPLLTVVAVCCGIFILILLVKLLVSFRMQKARNAIQSDPNIQKIRAVYRKGGYFDGSEQKKAICEQEYDSFKNYFLEGANTRQLFNYAILEIPIRQAAMYAFVAGVVLRPDFAPIDANSAQAQENLATIMLLQPEYCEYVQRRHDPKEADLILKLSAAQGSRPFEDELYEFMRY